MGARMIRITTPVVKGRLRAKDFYVGIALLCILAACGTQVFSTAEKPAEKPHRVDKTVAITDH
jgi:hypothetical protein